ncbi:hypothetical protein [Anabaena sp. UHCC 0204]|uniref:hypothetical protein n=1 Tax=Anabaena sp. UHCC 0204 TaxID=2590009 RepID=UPI0014451AF4|nr:hypothetical protein [Anabaena sp. UHCC 0204]MTJ10682.1 hypothetical protein [Anabaena sp. UHCC 0204]
MPEASIYREQALLNENTAQAAKQGFCDWAVIMCFYSALHWVNYHAYTNGNSQELILDKSKYSKGTRIPTLHDLKFYYVEKIVNEDSKKLRDTFQNSNNKNYKEKLEEVRKLQVAYESLFNASMRARYLHYLTTTSRAHYTSQNIEYFFNNLEIIKKRLS